MTKAGDNLRTRRGRRVFPVLILALTAAGAAWARDISQPAELPPASFTGQQYVDSNGCKFVRAGTADEVLWVPRVSRVGVPMCGNTASGGAVPTEEKAATAVSQEPAAEAAPQQRPSAAGGVFVAVGSFADPGNVTRAEARLAELGYGAVRGRLQGGSAALTTIYAGPFADAKAAASARQALSGQGFPDAIVVGP